MIVSDLNERLDEMSGQWSNTEDLPVMLAIEGLWFEVIGAHYDEDRVVLNIEAR